MIIGMGTVFISLYLLSVFMYLLGKFFGDKKVSKPNKIDNSADTGEIEELEIEDDISRKRKVAAITAAVYQLLDENQSYRIISIKKANSSWKR